MSYTLVPSELIVDGAITSAKLDTNISISGTLGVTGELTLATHLNMGDNDKIKIGTGGDLEIYHDGSNSYIANSTGNIYIADTNGAVHIQAKLNEESIVCAADGAVTLYHDNSAKLATASGGVTVTGTLTATTLAGTLSTAAQTNITSVGTLTSFRSTGIDDNADALAITIDSSENVAIGVTSAYTGGKLSLNGGLVQPSGNQHVLGVFGTSGLQLIGTTGGDNIVGTMGSSEPLIFRTVSAERMRIDANGNLGLGDSSPANFSGYVVASLADSTGAILDFKTTGSEGVFARIQGAVNNGLFITNEQAYPIAFNTNATERMRIDGSGNVSIGTTSSTEKLSVNGAITTTGALIDDRTSTGAMDFSGGATRIVSYGPSGTDGIFSFRAASGGASSTEKMRINHLGRQAFSQSATANAHGNFVGEVGTGFKALAFERTVGGGEVGSIVTNTSSTTYNTSSDLRLKNITGEARGLEVINKLNPVAYNWKADNSKDEGLVAQEVMKIVPNAVSGSEEDMYQIDYSKLVTPLIKAIQEQQAVIEDLKTRIETLEG